MLYISVPLGKLVRRVSRLRGGGSALPGLVVEKIDPGFMQRTLATLPHGVAVVSGTNGKTTTTKMVVELLESQGLKVFTNRTGSNFTRGVAAALLGEVDWRGRLDRRRRRPGAGRSPCRALREPGAAPLQPPP